MVSSLPRVCFKRKLCDILPFTASSQPYRGGFGEGGTADWHKSGYHVEFPRYFPLRMELPCISIYIFCHQFSLIFPTARAPFSDHAKPPPKGMKAVGLTFLIIRNKSGTFLGLCWCMRFPDLFPFYLHHVRSISVNFCHVRAVPISVLESLTKATCPNYCTTRVLVLCLLGSTVSAFNRYARALVRKVCLAM